MDNSKVFQAQVKYIYSKFAKIIVEDESINNAFKKIKGSKELKNNLLDLIISATIKRYTSNAEDASMKAICDFFEKQYNKMLDKFDDADGTDKFIEELLKTKYQEWVEAFGEAVQADMKKNADKKEEESEESSSVSDKESKVFEQIAVGFSKIMEKEPDFKSMLEGCPKDIKKDVWNCLVMNFCSHLFQDILNSRAACEWPQEVVQYALPFFEFSYKRLEESRDKIQPYAKDIDNIKHQIDELYLTYFRSYEKKLFRNLYDEEDE